MENVEKGVNKLTEPVTLGDKELSKEEEDLILLDTEGDPKGQPPSESQGQTGGGKWSDKNEEEAVGSGAEGGASGSGVEDLEGSLDKLDVSDPQVNDLPDRKKKKPLSWAVKRKRKKAKDAREAAASRSDTPSVNDPPPTNNSGGLLPERPSCSSNLRTPFRGGPTEDYSRGVAQAGPSSGKRPLQSPENSVRLVKTCHPGEDETLTVYITRTKGQLDNPDPVRPGYVQLVANAIHAGIDKLEDGEYMKIGGMGLVGGVI